MTIQECLESPKFQKLFLKEVQKIESVKDTLPPGKRLKRSPYDSLSEAGLMNAEDMAFMYVLVKNKNSNLSAHQRSFVVYFIEMVMKQVAP